MTDPLSPRTQAEKSADTDVLGEMIGFAAERLLELKSAPTPVPNGARSPD